LICAAPPPWGIIATSRRRVTAVARKGRARRFREARELKQGLADRPIESLLDSSEYVTISEEEFEDEYDDDEDEYDDDEEDDEDE
jgi:hypothetical protein